MAKFANDKQSSRADRWGRGRVLRRFTTAAVVLAGVMATTVLPAEASGDWIYFNVDADRCNEIALMDADGNGFFEDQWFDTDNDCSFDTRLWNTTGSDNFLEAMTFDMNEDGNWEVWHVDTDQRVGFEVAYFDDTGDGFYDRWQRIPAVANAAGSGSRWTTMTMGGPSEPSGVNRLLVQLAEATGTAVWGEPDRDGDGWSDNRDARPGDPFRH